MQRKNIIQSWRTEEFDRKKIHRKHILYALQMCVVCGRVVYKKTMVFMTVFVGSILYMWIGYRKKKQIFGVLEVVETYVLIF